MRCQEFKELMDSYLGDELLVETNHEVQHHLENCPACRKEMAARRALLGQMRSAFRSATEMQISPAFAINLQNALRETALRPNVWGKLKNKIFINPPVFAATLAACLIFGVLFGAIWLMRQPSLTPENNIARQNQTDTPAENPLPNESNTAAAAQIIQAAWRETARLAVGDHKNCALHFQLKEKPITLSEAARKYGKFYKDLDKAVIGSLRRDVPAEKVSGGKAAAKIEFLDAHSCVFNNRRFAHVILRKGKKTISILVTDADLNDENDASMTNYAIENLQVAGFRTANHAVFVVSDLSEQENLSVAETLSPAVRRHIEQTET